MVRLACALLACLALAGPASGAERRIALVIGNSAYANEPLFNPGNDARAVAQALRDSGFEVTERRNLNQRAMRRAIREFGDAIARGGVGLFYYAGHGIQHRGRNFLVPTGNDIQREDEIADQAVDVSLVLEKMRTARNSLNILILDACRNNPFGPQVPATAGLTTMDAPPRTIIAYATAPGQVAADGSGDNSIYTRHLVAHMSEPGIKLEDVFKRVRLAVRQETCGRQVPWENTSLEGDFYFRAPDPKVIAAEREEQRIEQQRAIDRAVQAALKRRSEQSAGDRAQIEKEIAERVAAERARAEREARKRIAAIERAAQDAIERARREMMRELAAAPVDARPEPAVVPSRPEETAANREPSAIAAPVGGVAKVLPKVGDSWTYKITTRDYGKVSERRSTARVRAVTDREIQMGRTRIGARYDHNWNALFLVNRRGLERTYEPRIPEFRFPLYPGSSWQDKYRTVRSDGREFDIDIDVTVVGWEDVPVPAGKFRAVKLTSVRWYRRSDVGGSGGGRAVVNRWYVPEVRRWVKSEFLDVGNNGIVYDDTTAELVSYKLQ